MKTPSRSMPAYVPKPVSPGHEALACSVLFLVLVGIVYVTWLYPWFLAFWIVVVVGTIYTNWRINRKLKNIAAGRTDEGICTFARSFDKNEVDTWIIRAIHEELQPLIKFPSGACPLRATDRFEEDLYIDYEDIEDLLPVVAQRTGRSVQSTEANPYYGKVLTVGDLVLFFNSQPKIAPQQKAQADSAR